MYKGPGVGGQCMFFLGTAKSVRLRSGRGLEAGVRRNVVTDEVHQAGVRPRAAIVTSFCLATTD